MNAIAKRTIPLIINVALMAGCLLGSAGRITWWNAWALIALSTVSGMAAERVLARDPGLTAERRNARAGKSWDKPLVGFLVLVGPMATWITAGSELRHHGAMRIPFVASVAAAVVAAAGSVVIVWAMRTNTYFSAVVRIQSDRGHAVVSNGPYGFIRHPGYAGMSAFMVATPAILGSRWAFVPAAVTLAVTVLRTALEDRTLRAELPGYADYAGRVRSRLVPLVW